MSTTIKDIYVGHINENEGLPLMEDEFMEAFFPPPGLSRENLLHGDISFIVGERGKGKTALMHYLCRSLKEEHPDAVSTYFFLNTVLEKEKASRVQKTPWGSIFWYGGEDKSEVDIQDYTLNWRWQIYLTFLRDNQGGRIFEKNQDWDRFEHLVLSLLQPSYVTKVPKSLDLFRSSNLPSLPSFLPQQLNLKWPNAKEKPKAYSLRALMEEMEASFLCLERTQAPYYLFFDDMEIETQNMDNDLRMMADLILEIKNLNQILKDIQWNENMGAICALDSHTLSYLEKELPNAHIEEEIKEKNYLLDWRNESSTNLSLWAQEIVKKRFHLALDKKGEKTKYQNVYFRWIPEELMKIMPESWFFFLSWNTPRDAVRFLSCAQMIDQNAECFSAPLLRQTILKYVIEYKREIREDLLKDYEESFLDKILNLIYKTYQSYTLEELTEIAKSKGLGKAPWEEILRDLFDHCVIEQYTENTIRAHYLGNSFQTGCKYCLSTLFLLFCENANAQTQAVLNQINKEMGWKKEDPDFAQELEEDEVIVSCVKAHRQVEAPVCEEPSQKKTKDKPLEAQEKPDKPLDAQKKSDKPLDAQKNPQEKEEKKEEKKPEKKEEKKPEKKPVPAKVKETQKLAMNGNPNAQYELALLYLQGEEVEKNEELAMQWCTKAAGQGLPIAQNKLGRMYDLGQGVPQDDQQAVLWYQKAADADLPQAQYNLAMMYVNGQGVPQDDRKAFQLLFQAAEHGLSIAQAHLGFMFCNGRGTEKDKRKAEKYFLASAEQGDAWGQYYLGYLYENFVLPKEDGCLMALEWYEKAANQGVTQAMMSLGSLYEEGRGVKKDKKEAASWYEKAAQHGDESGQAALDRLKKNPFSSLIGKILH